LSYLFPHSRPFAFIRGSTSSIEEVPRKMRDTAGETPALPFEKAASSFSSLRLSTFDFKTCDSLPLPQ
jgi:hypothetical protein